jgi:uncharacterized membrane protein YkoI
MKKKWKIALLASFLVVSIAFGTQRIIANQDKAVLTEEEVKKIVDKQYTGKIESMEPAEKGEQQVYKITFTNDKGKYELLMNAHNGEVMELLEIAIDDKKITEEQAKEIARKQVEGDIKSITQKQEDGKDIYVVEVQKKENEVVVLKIDKKTGGVISQPTANNKPPEPPTPTLITEQRAKDIAAEQVVGGTIVSTTLTESPKGRVYKVIAKKGQSTVDVRVHAITGEVISTTMTDDDDDDDDNKPASKPNNNQTKPNNQQKPPAKKPNQNQNDDDNDDNDDNQGNDDDGQDD